ncbi:HD domain-containing protein [Sulfurospirillum barnesii]|uniref:Bifunctional uridylyltransferase/uridylyl-removing enzyme n=1 Tax=Sulfurospirillum barnesii (strain ATCC 700032 / DSM 10660 / SES-3) TaxID=760154 RepID=I3XYM2_SULBS|nr:HD domain-containing protein [Sulfurospirillum barnesii]AFL69046.1 UTP:GlnB (protein PII) uridylyltransferase [Sulfurospirillum barnesii SES-3]
MEIEEIIEDLIEKNASDFEISKVIKEHIKAYLSSLNEIFVENQGKDFLVKHAKKIDQFIMIIYKYTLRKYFGNYMPFANAIPVVLVGMGSYGREELCVYSDIDLMVVYKALPGYNIEPLIQSMLYLAWDAGMKLGHRTHKLEELLSASNQDLTIKTAMLESRFLCGSKLLWMETERELLKIQKGDKGDKKEIIRQIIAAHEARRAKHPMSMEPNIKEGVGGLRDAHTLFWMCKILFGSIRIKDRVPEIINEEEYKEFRSALEFLYRVRSALHLSAKKKQDILNLEYIPDVAKKLGFEDKILKNAHMQLSSRTFASMHTVDVTCKIFMRKLTASLFLYPPCLNALKKGRIEKGLYRVNNIVYASLKKPNPKLSLVLEQLQNFDDAAVRFDISYVHYIKNAIYPVHNTPKTYKQIRSLLFQPNVYTLFSLLYEASLLPQLIKPFRHILDLAQFDGYHKLPVDIHSLHTLYHLENIQEPFIKALFDDLCPEGRAMLKLVAFLHDSGKGRKDDHSEIGAKIFKAYATKLHFSEKAIEMGVLLIKYHTLMSNTAYREDIYSEKVVLSFISKLQNPQALKLLYILTYADMSAVNDNIYSGFIAKLLREFYHYSMEMFEKEELIDETTKRLRKENSLKKSPEFLALSKGLQKKILSIQSNFFFLKLKLPEILFIAKEADETLSDSYRYIINNEDHLSIQVIRAKAFNIGYLLGKLSYLDLVQMDIYKLFDNKKYFQIDFNEKVQESDIAYITELLENSFDMSKRATLKKPTILKGEITLDFEHSKSYALMQLKTKNQQGLMAYMMSIFDEYNIDIAMAKIQTIKNRTRNLLLIEKTVGLCNNKDSILDYFY